MPVITNGTRLSLSVTDGPAVFNLSSWKEVHSMNYFLKNRLKQESMSDEELMTLALRNTDRTKAQRKKKKTKSCDRCQAVPSEEA
jgi:hypothetical protein